MKLILSGMMMAMTVTSPGLAQNKSATKDKTAEKLSRAKDSYTNVMARYSKAVTAALDAAEVKARQSGPDQVVLVKDQRELFDRYGCTPALCSSAIWSQRSGAHKRLLTAYRLAIRDYTRSKQDDKAQKVNDEMRQFWPEFLEDPAVGGWIPFGGARMEVQKGIVSLTATRNMSGLITKSNKVASPLMIFELAGSSDLNAWIGVRMKTARGKLTGQSCQIRAEGGGLKAGFWSRNFEKKQDNGAKVTLAPYDFFTEDIRVNAEARTLRISVDGSHTAAVGGLRVQEPGINGLFVQKGVLLIRNAVHKDSIN